MRSDAIASVSTCSFVNWPLVKNGGMFRCTPVGSKRSLIVNPLSAITTSPLSKGKDRNPLRFTSSLSEMHPVTSGETNVNVPSGVTPIKPLNVLLDL